MQFGCWNLVCMCVWITMDTAQSGVWCKNDKPVGRCEVNKYRWVLYMQA